MNKPPPGLTMPVHDFKYNGPDVLDTSSKKSFRQSAEPIVNNKYETELSSSQQNINTSSDFDDRNKNELYLDAKKLEFKNIMNSYYHSDNGLPNNISVKDKQFQAFNNEVADSDFEEQSNQNSLKDNRSNSPSSQISFDNKNKIKSSPYNFPIEHTSTIPFNSNFGYPSGNDNFSDQSSNDNHLNGYPLYKEDDMRSSVSPRAIPQEYQNRISSSKASYTENKPSYPYVLKKPHPLHEEPLHGSQYDMQRMRKTIPTPPSNSSRLPSMPYHPDDEYNYRDTAYDPRDPRRQTGPLMSYPPSTRPPVYGQSDRSSPHPVYRGVEEPSPSQHYRGMDDPYSDRSPHQYYRNADNNNHSERSPHQYYRGAEPHHPNRSSNRVVEEDILVYQVEFKLASRHFVAGSSMTPTSYNIGDFVKVEADRGEDLGVITDIFPFTFFMERWQEMNLVMNEDNFKLGNILRSATLAERHQLPEKSRDELGVVNTCQDLVLRVHKLPIDVINAEYQFDKHKLTIFYASDYRIDFRELVRDLFSAYKARIWMQKVDYFRPFVPNPYAARALQTGLQFSADMFLSR